MTTLLGAIAKRGPKLPGRLPLGGRGVGARIGQGQATANASGGAAIGGYKSVGSLFGVTNRIAEGVSLSEWQLYRQLPNGEREWIDDVQAPARHAATACWLQPNPWMDKQTFLHRTDQHLTLFGESTWLICQGGKGGPTIPSAAVSSDIELWPIRPDRLMPIPDPDQFIVGYVYKVGTQQIPVPKEAVVSLQIPDPEDLLHGFGPGQAIATDVETERYAAQWNRARFINGAEPGGIIQFDTPLSDVDFERLVTRWREQHQGVSNAFRVAILERGTWVDRKVTDRDMQFIQGRQHNEDLFFVTFGMPASIMGRQASANRSNSEAAQLDFAIWLLRPRLTRVKSACNSRVMPFFGDDLTMDYTDPTPQDEAQNVTQALALWIGRLATRNQCLEKAGLPTLDGPEGDDYLAQDAAPLVPKAPPSLHDPMESGRSVDEAVQKLLDPALRGHQNSMATFLRAGLETARDDLLDTLDGDR